MNKRILATLCVTIFVLATLATVQQVSAIYTLGDQLPNKVGETNAGGLPINPTNGEGNGQPQYPSQYMGPGAPFYNNYTGGHVAGHEAFVLPGSLYIPTSDQQSYYSPDGAIITGTQGDFFVYICVSDFTTNEVPGTVAPTTTTALEQSGPINISWRTPGTPSWPYSQPGSLFLLSKYLYIAIPPEFSPPNSSNWAAGWPDVLTTNQGFGDTSNIETTITNDHNMIMTGKFGAMHPVAPNWWFVRITAEPRTFPASRVSDLAQNDPLFNAKYTTDATYQGSSGFLYPPHMDPWQDRQISTQDTNGIEKNFAGCYRIKIMNMIAPKCAGKYFFKVFFTSTDQPEKSIGILPYNLNQTVTQLATSAIYGSTGGWPGLWQAPQAPPYMGFNWPNSNPGFQYGQINNDPWAGYLNGYFEKYQSFPPENYPCVVVKGDVDPGYISGTVRYCGHSQYYYGSYYGAGVETSGKVIATGTSPSGGAVCGEGWFLGQLPGQGTPWKDRGTGTAGYYEIEGLAPGIYTLTAYAAGFVPATLAAQITVNTGQSVHGVDIYVCPTAKLQTKVYSKCPTGPVNWPTYVTMDGFPASYAILPVVPGGADVRGTSSTGAQGSPVGPNAVWYWFTEGATTVQAKNIWNDLTSNAALANNIPFDPSPAQLGTAMNAYSTPAAMANIANKYGWAWQELIDSNGTKVAYKDFCFDITQDPRTFGTFWGDPSCYSGIETSWDGHVPTFLADFTSGITPGTYTVKTWVYGYVQTREYSVSFPAVEFPGTAYMEMDLFKGGIVNATVHFHLQPLPSAEIDPNTAPSEPGLPVVFQAIDANGVLQAWNSTADMQVNQPHATGISMMLIGDSNAWCDQGEVHGMPDGTYTMKAFKNGWVQQDFPQFTVQYCSNSSLSFHIFRGGLIQTTVYSRDCQDPSQPVNWLHPGENIMLVLYNSKTSWLSPAWWAESWDQQYATTSSVTLNAQGGGGFLTDYFRTCGGIKGGGLTTDTYTLEVLTPGYVQLQFPQVFVQMGSSVGDAPVYLLAGPTINVVVDFKTELIPAPLPKDFYSYYFRIEAYDSNGTLRAGNITAVPQTTYTTVSQYPWAGALNPAQPAGVQTWVFQLQGFSTFSTPVNKPADGSNDPGMSGPAGAGNQIWELIGYNDKGPKTIFQFSNGPHGDHAGYGLMWGTTYTIVVTEENQIGYIQLSTVTATPTCQGITTVIFEMDRLARIAGFEYTRNFMGDYRAGSWQTVTATGATTTYTAWGPYDGWYYTYVKPDTYTISAGGPGYKSGSVSEVVTWGGAGVAPFYLQESGVPIPEFPATGLLALVSALAASLFLLRWKRSTAIPVR